MKQFAGLDLSFEETQVCVVGENGTIISEAKVDSIPDAIAAALAPFQPLERVALETGRMAPAIYHGLRVQGVPVICIESRQAHQALQAMRAHKSDKGDALGLAQLARTGFYKAVHVKSLPAHAVKSVISARSRLVHVRVKIENHIRGLCATFGVRLGKGTGRNFASAAVERAGPTPGLHQAVSALLATRQSVMEQIAILDRQMRIFVRTVDACQRLMTILGVGVQTALAFVSAIDDAARFKRSREVGAYFGLVPRRHQSGEVEYTGRITKRGDGAVRKLLYEAVNSILTRYRGALAIKSWALQIARRAGLKKARVALARKLGTIMHPLDHRWHGVPNELSYRAPTTRHRSPRAEGSREGTRGRRLRRSSVGRPTLVQSAVVHCNAIRERPHAAPEIRVRREPSTPRGNSLLGRCGQPIRQQGLVAARCRLATPILWIVVRRLFDNRAHLNAHPAKVKKFGPVDHGAAL